jgi:hypothetical protein
MEVRMREKRSLTLHNSSESNWEEEEVYTELCAGEARRGIMWLEIGVWRLKKGICPYVAKKKIGTTY